MAGIPLEHDDTHQRPSISLVSVRSAVNEKNGRRRVRRRDNSRFAGNEHIVEPSLKDYEPPISLPRTTFPTPVPQFISRANPSLSAIPCRDPITANAGRYSLSLKGIRKRLRRAGPRTEQTVSEIDEALSAWLRTTAIIIKPDIPFVGPLDSVGVYVDASRSIQEISRSVLRLIWRVDDDFSRFLLHCVARFYGIVSYSKTISEAGRDIRVTYLLRPNATRPDFNAASRLETPPATDVDGLSTPADTETDSDTFSDTLDIEENLHEEEEVAVTGLPTVFEEDADEGRTSCMKSVDESGLVVSSAMAQLHISDWSEVNERTETAEMGTTIVDSLTLKLTRSRRSVFTRSHSTRSGSSPSPSSRRPHRRRARLHRFSPDKELRFCQYIYG